MKIDGFVKSIISPPLVGGDRGEVDHNLLINQFIITPTLALPRQGGGDFKEFLSLFFGLKNSSSKIIVNVIALKILFPMGHRPA